MWLLLPGFKIPKTKSEAGEELEDHKFTIFVTIFAAHFM